MAGLMLDTPLSREHREYAKVILSSGEALLAIINDILDFSKIASGKLTLQLEPFPIDEAVQEVTQLLEPLAREKGLEYRLQMLPGGPRWFVGDSGRIRQILVNLLGNAIKFTRAGHVSLTVLCQDAGHKRATLTMWVQDTGPGSPPDKMPLLFQKFTQLNTAGRPIPGTGLGLAITRQLAELMGGSVHVSSEVGRGSRFCCAIPLDTAEEPAPRTGSLASLAAAAGASHAPVRVLVAEDNRVNQMVISSMLRKLGCAVEMAPDGAATVSLALGAEFSMILMDCEMPEMDGFEATRRIRASSNGQARVPIIGFTAGVMEWERKRCFDAGMDDILAKPVRPAEVEAIVRKWAHRSPHTALAG
jgi:CheY-like chemotaxis protein